MKSTPSKIALLVTLTTLALTPAIPLPLHADTGTASANWGHWRGPTGNGTAPDADPPTEWSESENVKWKVAIPGAGSASPIVWGDRVFVTTAVGTNGKADGSKTPSSEGRAEQRRGGDRARRADGDRRRRPGGRGRPGGGGAGKPQETQRFQLLCLDRSTGDILWQRTAAETLPAEGHHPDHGFASASPFTDGERVYAHFGTRGLFCFDFEGKEIWKRTDFGPMSTRNGFGEGSSPTLHGDTIIVPWDHEGPSYITALDKRTGKTLWKTDRDEPTSWGTPLVITNGDHAQVVTTGQNFARGYDLATGKEIWRCAGQTQRPVASPVAGKDLIYVGSGFRGAFLGAFKRGASGDLESTDAVVWSVDSHTPDIPSLLLSGDRIYYIAGKSGMLSCRNALNGEAVFERERLDGISGVYASPVAASGKVYVAGRNGTIAVLKDDGDFTILATNKLDDGIDATPAIAGKQIFIRGNKHLYCISEHSYLRPNLHPNLC